MRPRWWETYRVAALIGAGHLLSASLLAQPGTNFQAGSGSNVTAAPPPLSQRTGPPLPLAVTPISFFRELLAMNAAERAQALTNRSPENRAQILAKVREYEAFEPDERELRLRVTELRWYLRPLMALPATNRASQLAMIPEPERKLVEVRLKQWDEVSLDVQKELLGLEPTLKYLTELEGRGDQQREALLRSISPAEREILEKGIEKWSSMTEPQRQKALYRFEQFFHLTAVEKDRLLGTLSEPERRQLRKR